MGVRGTKGATSPNSPRGAKRDAKWKPKREHAITGISQTWYKTKTHRRKNSKTWRETRTNPALQAGAKGGRQGEEGRGALSLVIYKRTLKNRAAQLYKVQTQMRRQPKPQPRVAIYNHRRRREPPVNCTRISQKTKNNDHQIKFEQKQCGTCAYRYSEATTRATKSCFLQQKTEKRTDNIL